MCCTRIEIIGLKGFPDVKKGDDIGKLIVEIARKNGVELMDGDVVIVAQKIVSKAEGRIVDLDKIVPSKTAYELGEKLGKDPRLVEVVLRECREVLKAESGHLIVLTRHGLVCANAGVDASNVDGSGIRVSLLPIDPDESARRIRKRIRELTGKNVVVVITDTFGRPFREGVVNFAIGFSGIAPFRDYIGKPDRYGYIMRVTRVCVVDEIAAAAELIMGQGGEGIPVVIMRGVKFDWDEKAGLEQVIMNRSKWLFR
ncbi:MAG: coenzyme F420-0:L-glutamate ligase [Thermoprotei archaeon]|nr:MAG: coenzyme F420-0:L-glutamate ligase [Thermoprotei archaeon]RLF23745.1 MAG: coenzyme F420-0:L-glutamate ligase [Thermoprotei archaeon]